MELVVSRNFLADGSVLLKQAEGANERQKPLRLEQAPHHGFQVPVAAQGIRVVLMVDGAPAQEALLIGTQRANPRLKAVADHQQHVGNEQLRDVGFVGPQLLERRPNVRFLVGGILQFHHRHGQAVDVDHQVRAAAVPVALYGQLIHHQPVVGGRVVKAEHLQAFARLLVLLHHGDGHALGDPAVQLTVGRQQSRHVGIGQLLNSSVNAVNGNARIQSPQRRPQPPPKNHLTVIRPLRGRTVRAQIRAKGMVVAQLPEPGDGLALQVLFRD